MMLRKLAQLLAGTSIVLAACAFMAAFGGAATVDGMYSEYLTVVLLFIFPLSSALTPRTMPARRPRHAAREAL